MKEFALIIEYDGFHSNRIDQPVRLHTLLLLRGLL